MGVSAMSSSKTDSDLSNSTTTAPLLAAILVEIIGGDGSGRGGSVIGGIAVIAAAENV